MASCGLGIRGVHSQLLAIACNIQVTPLRQLFCFSSHSILIPALEQSVVELHYTPCLLPYFVCREFLKTKSVKDQKNRGGERAEVVASRLDPNGEGHPGTPCETWAQPGLAIELHALKYRR